MARNRIERRLTMPKPGLERGRSSIEAAFAEAASSLHLEGMGLRFPLRDCQRTRISAFMWQSSWHRPDSLFKRQD